MMMSRARPVSMVLALAGCLTMSQALRAQDTSRAEGGVRVGITYKPGTRPGVLMLGGVRDARLDSVRAIIRRDLDYSDRFEVIAPEGSDSLTLGIGPNATSTSANNAGSYVNYALYRILGADYAVNVTHADDSTLSVTVYDVRGKAAHRDIRIGLRAADDPAFRHAVHKASDEIVNAAISRPGIAATRFLFIRRDRVYQIDSDGMGLTPISRAGAHAMSPSWAPGGRRMAYMEFAKEGGTRLYTVDLGSGEPRVVTPTTQHQNWTPVFSPDGETVAFGRAVEGSADIWTYNLARQCCLQRLTVGGLSDNLSPTYSPDGRRIAFISNRAGGTQVYVMSADGTGQELLAPFDYGVTGPSNAPEWSPDGLSVTFHRDVERAPQIFVMDLATRKPRALTSIGRNSDPTWAPDGKHIAFVSDRTGSAQIWIIDVDTGRPRQLTRQGESRMPAWSPRIP